MYQVKAADVAKLRNTTGAGMMDSKKALQEAEGDFDKAIEILRKKGQKVAAKRADREASEGAVIAKVNDDNTKGVIVALNCETDFVAKNEDFVKLANDIAEFALDYDDLDTMLEADFNGLPLKDKLTEQTGVIGEKIEIGAFDVLEAPYVGYYIHAGNKIAALTGLSHSVENGEEVAKSVSMQVAAMNPVALDESGVSQEIIDKEVEIAKEQLRKEGKPEQMLDKITEGKMQKFYAENTLVNQKYIKDGDMTVKQYVSQDNPDLTVVNYSRVSLS